MPRAPKWTGNAAFEQVFPLSNGGRVQASGDLQLGSRRFLDTTFTSKSRVSGYALLNVSLTYTAPHDRWSLTGFVRNATNAKLYQGGFTAFTPSILAATINPPRSYGARLTYNF